VVCPRNLDAGAIGHAHERGQRPSRSAALTPRQRRRIAPHWTFVQWQKAGLVAKVAPLGQFSFPDRDRRHDRRQAVVAGAVRHEIAEDRAEAHYRDCMRGERYDRECDRQRYYEEQEARRKGRRTAVAVGVLN
jgi:hypothetical protein